MAARTYAKSTPSPSASSRNAYRPIVSSALNPNAPKERLQLPRHLQRPQQPGSQRPQELRPHEVLHLTKLIAKRRRRGRRASDRTLCARLLRRNVQVAWREHVLMAQFAQYESCAMQETQNQEQPDPTVPRTFTKPSVSTFRMPDMSVLKSKRAMVAAVGLAGVIPAMKMHSYMRPATAA